MRWLRRYLQRRQIGRRVVVDVHEQPINQKIAEGMAEIETMLALEWLWSQPCLGEGAEA